MRLQSRMRTATDTTLRHLAMLTAIPVGLPGKSTSQILMELLDKSPDFNVDRRTIQRSLVQLSQRFPITAETRGRTNNWYRIEPHALTQIPAMTASTAFVLRVSIDRILFQPQHKPPFKYRLESKNGPEHFQVRNEGIVAGRDHMLAGRLRKGCER